MKVVIACVFVFVATILADAQEFWLQPRKFNYAVGEEIKIDFKSGENFEGDFWDARNSIEKFQLYRATGVIDLLKEVKRTKENNLLLTADKEGAYLFALHSTTPVKEIAGGTFNIFLEDHGIDDLLNERKKLNHLNTPIKEAKIYFSKLLIQVGANADITYTKRVGHAFEMVPEVNPGKLKPGDYLPCKVFFEGKPSPHTLVKVWSKINNTTFLQNIYTEKDGSFSFPISTRGLWMVSSVRMNKANTKDADYTTLYTSLTFGI